MHPLRSFWRFPCANLITRVVTSSVMVWPMYREVIKIILTAEERRTETRGDSSHFINHMVLLITVIMYFDLCMAARSIKTSPAGCLTSAPNVCTHLESDIWFSRGINLINVPYVASWCKPRHSVRKICSEIQTAWWWLKTCLWLALQEINNPCSHIQCKKKKNCNIWQTKDEL